MTSSLPAIVQVDAFAEYPFSGNPAAVCVLETAASDEWMQKVAAEMNLSETAFLVPQDDGYQLRWFTPMIEVDLCGHATLASAHALWTEGHLAKDRQARFHTKSGLLTAEKQGDWIELNFPSQPPTPTTLPEELFASLGLGDIEASNSAVLATETNYFVDLSQVIVDAAEAAAVLRSLSPNFPALSKAPRQGVIVTCRSEDSKYDFLSRYFAPNAGIDEDPVTGSAHCTLAPYWQTQLQKNPMVGYQASARGGVVKVECQGDRVAISGQAITVLSGQLQQPQQ